MAVKDLLFIPLSIIGPSYDDFWDQDKGVGHPMIRTAENWKVEDSLRGVLAKHWWYGPGPYTDEGAAAWNGIGVLASAATGQGFDIQTTSIGAVTTQLELIYRHAMPDHMNTWGGYYSVAINEHNWPPIEQYFAHLGAEGTDIEPFEVFLKLLNDTGDPYFRKYIKDGIPSDDQITGFSGEFIAPVITEDWRPFNATYLKTTIAAPSDEENPGFTISIKPEYKWYNSVLEKTFPLTGLTEEALPNFYMVNSLVRQGTSPTWPDVYKTHANLFGAVEMTANYTYEGGYMGQYHLALNRLINGETIPSAPDLAEIGNLMETYKNIGFRPRSLDYFNDKVTEEVLRNTGYYIDIEFNDNGNDGNTIRNALESNGLFESIATVLIESDVAQTGLGPIFNEMTDEDINTALPYENFTTDYHGKITGDSDEGTITIQWQQELAQLLSAGPGAGSVSGYDAARLTQYYQHIMEAGPAHPASYHLYYMGEDRITGHSSDGYPQFVAAPDPDHAPDGVWLSSHYDPLFSSSTMMNDPLNVADWNDNLDTWAGSLGTAITEFFDGLKLNFTDIMNGEDCYSETLVYKIEKRRVDIDGNESDVVQTIYIPKVMNGADPSTNSFRYIDTQVFYGQRYKYDIKPIRVVVGNSYKYSNVQVSSDLVQSSGNGLALANAMGFFKEEEQGIIYAYAATAGGSQSWPGEEGDMRDTPIRAPSQIGYYVFKHSDADVGAEQMGTLEDPYFGGSGDYETIWRTVGGSTSTATEYYIPFDVDQETALSKLKITLVRGDGVDDNENGGAIPESVIRNASAGSGVVITTAAAAHGHTAGTVPPFTIPGMAGSQCDDNDDCSHELVCYPAGICGPVL